MKAWVDGILTVGGIVVGGLLLLTPEPTGATKALGYLFITASAARSAIAIYENLELGIDALDPRNVIEGLSILTSVLGVSGRCCASTASARSRRSCTGSATGP